MDFFSWIFFIAVVGDDEGIRFGSKSLFSVKAEDSAIERVDLGGVSRSRGVGGSPSNTADESVTTRKCDNEAKLATQAGTQFTYFTGTKVQILTQRCFME
jgi:hypothetical protein